MVVMVVIVVVVDCRFLSFSSCGSCGVNMTYSVWLCRILNRKGMHKHKYMHKKPCNKVIIM